MSASGLRWCGLGYCRTVIALPSGMGSMPGTDICLWVLRRPSGKPDRAPVRMIDLSGLGDAADVPREFAAWRQLLEDEDPTVIRAVARLELLDDGARAAAVAVPEAAWGGHRR